MSNKTTRPQPLNKNLKKRSDGKASPAGGLGRLAILGRGPRLIIAALIFAAVGIWLLRSSFAAVAFSDAMDSYPEGLITSEYSYYNSTATDAKKNPKWQMTSGSLFSATYNGVKAGYSGFPTPAGTGPNPTPAANNNSAVFRMISVPSNFSNSEVSFRLLNKQMSQSTSFPAVAWDGVHVWLRYQSEEGLYAASVNRRDGSVVIKKKTPGGPSNGGTYYTLASTSSNAQPIPYGTWQNIKASIVTNADKTVTIKIYRENSLVLTAIDNGTLGGAPILAPGKVGIRGDNCEFYFNNVVVNESTPTDTTNPIVPPPVVAPPDTTAPTVAVTSPANGANLVGTANIAVNASDDVGVAKVDFYDGQTLLYSDTTAPYSWSWDTTKFQNGSHTLTAVAYDAAQNNRRSSAVTVNVNNATTVPVADIEPPVVTITSPSNNANVSKTFSITANAQDKSPIKNISVYVDGNLKSTTIGGSLNTRVTINNTGNHTIMVTAIDNSGNIGKSYINVWSNSK